MTDLSSRLTRRMRSWLPLLGGELRRTVDLLSGVLAVHPELAPLVSDHARRLRDLLDDFSEDFSDVETAARELESSACRTQGSLTSLSRSADAEVTQ